MDINSFGTGVSPDNVPDIAKLVQEARGIASGIESSWTKKKLFTLGDVQNPLSVQTFSNGQWFARVSEHPNAHGKMLKYIGGSTEDMDANHTAYEVQYIDTLSTYSLTKVLSKSATSTAYTAKLVYLMPFPLKDRVFYEIIIVDKSEDGSEFFVISLPIPPPSTSSSKLVPATYHSIEWIKNGKWIMCTKANSGGMVPKFVANASLPSVISHDVEAFFKFVKQG